MKRGLSSVLILIAFLPAAGLFCACRKGPVPQPSELVVGLEGNPKNLDPRVAQDAYSIRILALIFEGLTTIDKNSEPAPCLAEKWEQPDVLTWVFHLGRGHRTPDGAEITAADVIYTFQSLADPELLSPYRKILDNIRDMQAPDDFTVVFKLKDKYAPFLADVTLGIVPADAGKNFKEFGKKPRGSGPYQVESFEPGAEVVLTINPGGHGEPPPIGRIVFRVIPDDVTRVMALERGDVHLLQNSVPPDDIKVLRQNPRIEVKIEPGIGYSYLGLNLEDPILADLRVRRAIAHAIDREKTADCLLRNTVSPASGILSPSHWAYNPDVMTYNHDPELAKSLLDEAGYPDPDGDGPEPRFHLVYMTSQNKTRRWIADAIADQLGQVGISVAVRSYEFGTFFDDIRQGRFQIYSLTWPGVADPDIYYYAFNSESIPPAGANRNRYRDPELDRLTIEGRQTLERDSRRPIYFRAQEIIARDLPYISLWYNDNLVACDRRLSGFEIYPGGDYRSLAKTSWRSEP